MNRRTATLLSVLVLCSLCVALGYSLRGRQEARVDDGPTYLEQITEQLGLSAGQIADIDRLLAQHDTDVDALLEEHRNQLRETLRVRLEQTEEALLDILDEDQRMLYASLTRH